MTEFEQVLGRLDRAGHVRRSDEREVTVEGISLVRDDEREALLLQQEEVFDRLVGKHEDRPVDLSLDELVDERDLSRLMVKVGHRTACMSSSYSASVKPVISWAK